MGVLNTETSLTKKDKNSEIHKLKRSSMNVLRCPKLTTGDWKPKGCIEGMSEKYFKKYTYETYVRSTSV